MARSVLIHHTRHVVLSLAVFVLLAAIHTWPLAAAPAHWSRTDGGRSACWRGAGPAGGRPATWARDEDVLIYELLRR